MYFASYKLKIWNEIDHREEYVMGVTTTCNGTLVNAMKNIEKYYGDDIIKVLELEIQESSSVYEFSCSK